MELRHRPAVQSGVGILESAVGEGFAAALQAGLSRAIVGRPGHTAPARPSGPASPDRTAVLNQFEAAATRVLTTRQERQADASPLTNHAGRVPGPADVPAGAIAADRDHLWCELPPAAAALRPRSMVRQPPEGAQSAEQTADVLWDERRRLAREVHDEIGTPIDLALRRLTLLGTAAGDPGGHLGAVQEALAQAERRIAGLVGGLRAETDVPLLKESVRDFAVQAAPANLKVSVSSTGQERDLPDAWRREIFLAVRECLRNSFAHASATQVSVVSRVTRRWAHVRIEDNGTGFEPGPHLPPHREGHGMRSMAERIEALGGRLAVRSGPAGGTRVDIHVPVRPYA
ncbi:ATP-binding protein [Streptomyces sp. NPDC088348]|uniref:ATP-binding protein n=1 Tax=Streptomyces sp. NPDC088348 TaxID=3365853 RepID=UPI00380FEEC3